MPSKPMTVTLTNNNQLVLPPRIRRKAGFKAGDQLEVNAIGGVVTFISKGAVVAEDEYTPEQRRQIMAEIEEARKGSYHGPFKSGEEFAAYFKAYKRSLRGSPTKAKKSR
jgi:AbrB family looped-hinge helix DNA binding protein